MATAYKKTETIERDVGDVCNNVLNFLCNAIVDSSKKGPATTFGI